MSDKLQPYLARLKALPFVRAVQIARDDEHEGASIVLEAGSRKYKFLFYLVRSHLDRGDAEKWVGRAASQATDRPILLFAPYVSRPTGTRLRDAGVQYLDEVGNMYLELKGKGAVQHVAFVEGKTPLRIRNAERAWRAPSYQVLFTLLAKPSLLAATVREVAAQADVSTTPVLQVRDKLREHGFAVQTGSGLVWTPKGQREARELWRRGYQSTLRPSLLIQRFRPRASLDIPGLEAEIETRLSRELIWCWGGAAAAYRLDPYYRGELTVLHVQDQGRRHDEFAKLLRMLPDPQGPVILLRRPGLLAFDGGTSEVSESKAEHPVMTARVPTAHPLLIWAELLEEGADRASEAAAQIEENYLEEARHER